MFKVFAVLFKVNFHLERTLNRINTGVITIYVQGVPAILLYSLFFYTYISVLLIFLVIFISIIYIINIISCFYLLHLEQFSNYAAFTLNVRHEQRGTTH